MNKTPLYDAHLQAGGKMVDFHGWQLPLHYGSQLEEHYRVRNSAGMFDVSHMGVIDVHGPEVTDFLRQLLTNDIAKLSGINSGLYTCMLSHDGCILDDLIVYCLDDNYYRLIVNSATKEDDLKWIMERANTFAVEVNEMKNLAIVAVQGPAAIELVAEKIFPQYFVAIRNLAYFKVFCHGELFIARTGYTGEEGLEIILPNEQVTDLWRALLQHGAQPCGLGARDSLRLEAGYTLYGNDADQSVTPLESNLAFTVAWDPQDRDFIGRAELTKQIEAGVEKKIVGLVVAEAGGIPRAGQKVLFDGIGEGVITSGGFSPTLKMGIALARVPYNVSGDMQAKIAIRDKLVTARVVKPPFIKLNVVASAVK